MNGASMLERFYALNPRRRVIFLNCENERYSGEYLRLNLDILTESLIALGLEFELSENEIFLFGKDIQARLLFECGILCGEGENCAILRPYANACDIMSAVCRIKANFEK